MKKTKPKTEMRRFQLIRDVDVSGVSGTGIVAEGCEMTSGKVILTWLSNLSTVEICDNAKVLEEIHGHEGSTKIVFLD